MHIFIDLVTVDFMTYVERFGEIPWEMVEIIKKQSAFFDIRCLPFIDPVGNAIFNKKQALQILKEISFFEQKNLLFKEVLEKIKIAANKVLTSKNLYLKFEGE